MRYFILYSPYIIILNIIILPLYNQTCFPDWIYFDWFPSVAPWHSYIVQQFNTHDYTTISNICEMYWKVIHCTVRIKEYLKYIVKKWEVLSCVLNVVLSNILLVPLETLPSEENLSSSFVAMCCFFNAFSLLSVIMTNREN